MASVTRSESANPVQKPYGKVILTTKNCLLPVEKFETTPSCLDGLEPEQETDLRILGCELIQTAGILLRLPQVAMATGQVIYQRFFHSKSFIKHNMEVTAMGCVCLASKIEEAPRRIRDVINVFHHIKQVRYKRPVQPLILDQNYINLKNQVIKAERRVLKELGFCVHVKHPHKIIVTYLQVLECEKNQKLIQTSWNYMNDSLRTSVFLRYQPEAVACACIHISARQLRIPLPNRPAWYLLFGVTEEEINDISYAILKLYTRHKPDGDALDKVVEDIRKLQLEAKLKAKGILGNNTPQGAGFSPSSRPNTPRQEKSPAEGEKEKTKDDAKNNADYSPRSRNEQNHVKKAQRNSRSPDSNKSGHNTRSSGSNSASPSPKRKARTPPRGYKDTRKSQSRSRTRSRSPNHDRGSKDVKRASRSSHKRRRSPIPRSTSRSYSRSPISHSRGSALPSSGGVAGSKKSHHRHHHHHHHKESKSRYKSRSVSHERDREPRIHRDRSRSRSRSYDKYKSRKADRHNNRDNGHHRSRSRDRRR